ncbi:hypothetical protein Leryth_007439 [Lithospermum erythrorhizon]|nr:hypothetical protein Leryth_007439 [Lithospermum erythrorhizon]
MRKGVQKLPDARDQRTGVISLGKNEIRAPLKDLQKPGKFCEMLIDMLPEHLAFTIFCPSEKAFKRDLRLRWNDSLLEENKEDDDTYAILTRILGFSTVPRSIFSGDLVYGNEVNYDSLSGHVLYIWKDMKGGFVVNRVKSEVMDLKRGKTVVHLMDGVIMTPDFEEAMKPDDDDADQETEEANN